MRPRTANLRRARCCSDMARPFAVIAGPLRSECSSMEVSSQWLTPLSRNVAISVTILRSDGGALELKRTCPLRCWPRDPPLCCIQVVMTPAGDGDLLFLVVNVAAMLLRTRALDVSRSYRFMYLVGLTFDYLHIKIPA